MILKKVINTAILALSVNTLAVSQTINIFDKTTQHPIAEVEVFIKNTRISAISSSRGEVFFNDLHYEDTLVFKHITYELKILPFNVLKTNGFLVELEEKNITLDEFIVTANRWEEDKIENPFRIEKITIKKISFQNPQTAADLLGATNFAYVQKSQLAGGSPILRGFATNRVMIVVDGVRMNTAIFRTGNVQNVISIDAASVQSSEILFGPGAVMYGSDAIGGVMDFHTLKPFCSDTDKIIISGNAFSRYSSANKEKTGHLDFNIGLKKMAFLSSISYSDYDDLKTGSNGNSYYLRPTYQERINDRDSQLVNKNPHVLVHSAYNQLNFLQKISYQPTKNWNLDYSFIYSKASDAPRFDRLYLDANSDGKLDYAQWYYGPQLWIMNRIGLTNTFNSKLYDQLRLIAVYQNFEESRHDRKFGNSRLRNQTEKVDALSINIDMGKNLREKFTLFYGGEIVSNKIGSEANKKNINTGEIQPTNTRYPNGSTWRSLGIYTNIKYQFNRKTTINAGLRYSYYTINAVFDTSMFPFPFVKAENKNGSLNGSIGIVYIPNSTWQLYLNGSTGFRAPNIDDIGKVFESEPGSVVVPNPNLKSEYAYNFEIGTVKTIGNFLKFNLSAYYTMLNDALARRNYIFNGEDSIIYDGQLSRVQAIQNITKAYIYGIQSELEFYFGKGFGVKSTLSYQYGREQSADSLKYYPLRHAVPLFGSTHITCKIKRFEADLYSTYNGKMEYEDFALSERSDSYSYAKDARGLPYVPSWYTLNIKFALYINKNLYINAGIENITDQLYRPYESGISAPGRNYLVTLRTRF